MHILNLSTNTWVGNTVYIRKVMNKIKGSLTITQTNVSVNKPISLIHIIIQKVHDKMFPILMNTGGAHHFLPHRHGSLQIFDIINVFELLSKTCNFTICSFFSNSSHVGWCTVSPDTILKLDTLVMIQTKFGFHSSSTFRGEDF